jgi:hypothetical protein
MGGSFSRGSPRGQATAQAMTALLADGGPLDQTSTILAIAAVLAGLVAVQRLRGRAFGSVPRPAAYATAGLAVVLLVLAFVVPSIINPSPASARPRSTATLGILAPRPGQVFRGNPAVVTVRLSLRDARIVPFTSTRLTPGTGHIHLYVDGALVSMTYGLSQRLRVTPGRHTLLAEFVAVDHAPFYSPVTARVRFTVER